jgi:hypothetical protein
MLMKRIDDFKKDMENKNIHAEVKVEGLWIEILLKPKGEQSKGGDEDDKAGADTQS